MAAKAEPRLKENRWDKGLEKALLEKWEKEKLYRTPEGAKRLFTIDTPPPYPSGRPWHIGAAAHYSQIDMIARTARMMGKPVYFPLGIDRNGLPVETYTEKLHNIKLQDVSREHFVQLCSTALDDLEREMIGIMRTMGMSCDFANYYRTDSYDYRAFTQATFIELWKRGMIYEDTRPNNFCVDCGTTIADAEIVYLDLDTKLVHVKFKTKGGGELVIATTRPELLCSCQVVMVNPKDDRYRDTVGEHVAVPLYNKEVKVIAHPYAKPEFGTGVVMMCSYGDYSDVRIFRELRLKEIIAINEKGRMTEAAGKYKGMKIEEAREAVIRDLKKEGLIVKIETMKHRTPTCERSKTPIQIIPMKEWYLRQLEVKEKIRDISKKMVFHPEHHRIILNNWIDSITIDWPLSRRRYYGTDIPIWFCRSCKKPCLPEPGEYVQPWKEDPPFKACPHCKKSGGFEGETRTFDTWMDSSISPLYISKYRKDDRFFRTSFPNGIRPQGKDIVRTWLYYTLLRCYQLTGNCAFDHTWIMGYCVDERGEKMSKSKGNVIDPIPVLEKFGADSFRFWATTESSLGSDFRASEDRVENASKFLTKLWNVARFISMFPAPKGKGKPNSLDRWVLGELNNMVKKCEEGYKDFNFFIPANAVRDFVWNIFAPHYLEMAKSRAYSGDNAALDVLNTCLRTLLVYLAPVTPFITDHIYRALFDPKGVHLQTLPKAGKAEKSPFKTEELVELNSQIWKAKKDKGLSLRTEVKSLTIPTKFKTIEQDLKQTHQVKTLKYGSKLNIVL